MSSGSLVAVVMVLSCLIAFMAVAVLSDAGCIFATFSILDE